MERRISPADTLRGKRSYARQGFTQGFWDYFPSLKGDAARTVAMTIFLLDMIFSVLNRTDVN